MQDSALLTQYVQDGSDAAFSQLLARHLPLVYRTCRRELGSDVPGVEGDLSKQSAYTIDEHSDLPSAMFRQEAPSYNVSISVYRGVSDKVTAITLIYCSN